MSASLRALIFPLLLYFLVALALPTPARASDDWLPISPEELKMTAEPEAPGAPAIYLYRQVDRNVAEYRENNNARIKIFTEEGRKYAEVEIPLVKRYATIKGIQARTIHADGSIVDFNGKLYDKKSSRQKV